MDKSKFIKLVILSLSLLILNSCQAIAGIFKAGIWTGIIGIIIIIIIIFWLISKMKKNQ